jgi:hypothetical protein
LTFRPGTKALIRRFMPGLTGNMSSILRNERFDLADFLWFWNPRLRNILPEPVTLMRLAVALCVLIFGTLSSFLDSS